MPSAWFAAVMFSFMALIHLIQYFNNRAWFMYFFFVGISMEVAGYWVRIRSLKNPDQYGAAFATYLLTT